MAVYVNTQFQTLYPKLTSAQQYFKWEGPNDAKVTTLIHPEIRIAKLTKTNAQLLLLTQGRWVKPDEYPQLSSAFPGAYHFPLHTPSPLPYPHPIHSHTHTPVPQPPNPQLIPRPHIGTSTGSIRNRISALRVKQRDLYLELNWDLPEGAAGHSAKKNSGTRPGTSTPKTGTPKKRAADADAGEEGEAGTPSKKPRARKAKAGKKEKDVVEESLGEGGLEEGDGDAEVEEPYIPMAKRVKEEVLDEEMV